MRSSAAVDGSSSSDQTAAVDRSSADVVELARAATAAAEARQRRRRVAMRVAQLATVASVLAAWQSTGSSSAYWRFVIGRPSDVLGVLRDWAGDGDRWGDLRVTLSAALYGYLLGAGSAVVVAFLVSLNRWFERFLTPFIAATNAIPKVALIPLFLVWFGLSTQSKVYFVALSSFFLVFWNTLAGIRSIDPVYLMNARALGAPRAWMLREVYIPSVLGWVMTSLRLGASWALLSTVLAEWVGSVAGIGNIIARAANVQRVNEVLAGIFLAALVALLVDRCLLRVERRFSRWRLT